MKYLVTFLAGLLLGVGGALAAAYYNPLADAGSSTAFPADGRMFGYGLFDASLASTHAAGAGLPLHPDGIGELWEETIAGAALHAVLLRGPDGPPRAIATRISVPAEGTALLTEGVIVRDYWLLTVPGEGSMFMQVHSNAWPLIKRLLVGRYLDRPWSGPPTLQPTVGPGPAGTALVRGATGRFAGAEGSAIERYHLSSLAPGGELSALDVELSLSLPASEQDGG